MNKTKKLTLRAERNMVCALCAVIFLVFAGAALAGWLARFALQRRNAPEHLCCIVAAFVSSLLAGIGANILGFKTDIAISTSILYLVPGVPLLNAFIDMFDGHILAGFSRLVKASETILAMTLGLLGAILILGRAIL